MKKRIVVICPGRGSYTKETLGYLRQYGAAVRDFLDDMDRRRIQRNEPAITALDSADTFQPQMHTRGEHASALIYACAYADFKAIDRDRYEIVAMTGNSMGWYLALAFSESLDWAGGFEVVNTMGSMMKDEIIGGQVIYPISDKDWVKSPERIAAVETAVTRARGTTGVEIFASIYLGGFLVLGANKAGVAALLKELPPVENYPFQLIHHAAFHTPLLRDVSARAFRTLPLTLFRKPQIPLIDGRGGIWQPYSTSLSDLYTYTFGHQVVEPYDFTRAVSVALKEFAPDHLVLLGPGSSLGGAIGQILIENRWKNLSSKSDFMQVQVESPLLLSMGRADQRSALVRG
ncbi:MAG: ACP S-malonyltransferase [Bdellovibrionales bacterium]